MDQEDSNSIKTDIALIKSNIIQIEKFLTSLEKTSSQIPVFLKELAVQKSIIDSFEQRIKFLENQTYIEYSKNETFRKEINSQISAIRFDIDKKLEKLVENLSKTASKDHHDIVERIREIIDEIKDKNVNQDIKIENFNQWKWYISGGIVVVTFLLTLLWNNILG